jgi:hypothetical protein
MVWRVGVTRFLTSTKEKLNESIMVLNKSLQVLAVPELERLPSY